MNIDDEIDKRRMLEISYIAFMYDKNPGIFLVSCFKMFLDAHREYRPSENFVVMYKSDFAKLVENQKEEVT
jgi:hypothetical protein